MEFDVEKTTQSNLSNVVTDYTLDTYLPDTAGSGEETTYINSEWHTQIGVFKNSPHFHRAITALSTWTAGKGYTTDNATQAILENITGWGNETFDEILMNLQNQKKITGDAFAEIIRSEKGTLINLKVLGGDTIKTHVNSKGIITKYTQVSRIGKKGTERTFTTNQILHLTNDRLADEIHGVSTAELVSWVVTAIREAETDWKRISHRSTIRVLYIDADDNDKLTRVKTQYAEGIKNGEILIIPAKKGDAEFQDLVLPPVDAFLKWMNYLEGQFYQIVGVPRVIATAEGFTESSSKMAVFTFDPTYTKEQVLMEGDLWNQLAIKIKFNRPATLSNELATDEAKDGAAIQSNDTQAGVGA